MGGACVGHCAAILAETGSEGCLESRYRSTVLVAPDLRGEWDEVAGLSHAPGGAS